MEEENLKNKNQKTARLIGYYYFSKRGKRIKCGKNYEEAVEKFIKEVVRHTYNNWLYGSYYTEGNYHVITVLIAHYNAEKDTIVYIKRDDI